MSTTLVHADEALERWRDRVKAQSGRSAIRDRENPRPKRESAESPRTIAEAATELGLSVHTIRSWVASRRLGHIRLGRAIRIPAAEIRRMIDKNTVPAVEER